MNIEEIEANQILTYPCLFDIGISYISQANKEATKELWCCGISPSSILNMRVDYYTHLKNRYHINKTSLNSLARLLLGI